MVVKGSSVTRKLTDRIKGWLVSKELLVIVTRPCGRALAYVNLGTNLLV